jgi:hypothetical protein
VSFYVPKDFNPARRVKVHVTKHPAFTSPWAVIERGIANAETHFRPNPGESEEQFMRRAIRNAEAMPHVLEISIYLPEKRERARLDD